MKFFICLVVLAAATHASIDINAPSRAFVAGGSSVPFPVIGIEPNEPTVDLQQLLLNETGSFITDLVNSLSRQITVLTRFYSRSIDKYTENFARSIYLASNGQENEGSIDHALTLLNNVLQGAVSLIPQDFGGDAVSAQVSASSEEVFNISLRIGEITLHDLINNAPIILDAAVKSVVDFQKEVLNAGMAGIAESYPQLHRQFSTDACVNYILPALRDAVITVLASETMTKEHAEPETWKKFEEMAQRVYGIFETANAQQ